MDTAVLFDLFGVIACHQDPAGRAELERLAAVPQEALWEAYWRFRPPYDRGETSSAAYWSAIGDALGRPFDAPDLTALAATDTASWGAVDAEMAAFVAGLASSRRIALLSNIPTDLAVYYERRHSQLLARFEVVGFSSRIGSAKPEPEAYRYITTALGLAPARILFIDDRAENLEAAAVLGFRTHLFTGRDSAAAAIRSGMEKPGQGGAH